MEGNESGDVRDRVRNMSDEERQYRYSQLQQLRTFWRESGCKDPQQQMEIFQVGYTVVTRYSKIRHNVFHFTVH